MAASLQSLLPSSRGLSPCVSLGILHCFHGVVDHWTQGPPILVARHFTSISKDPISKSYHLLRFWVDMSFERMLGNPLQQLSSEILLFVGLDWAVALGRATETIREVFEVHIS